MIKKLIVEGVGFDSKGNELYIGSYVLVQDEGKGNIRAVNRNEHMYVIELDNGEMIEETADRIIAIDFGDISTGEFESRKIKEGLFDDERFYLQKKDKLKELLLNNELRMAIIEYDDMAEKTGYTGKKIRDFLIDLDLWS